MDIYHYHPTTGELLGMGLADPDPLTPDNWLVPAHATTVEPPASESGKARVFGNGEWTQIVDHRGETWWDDQGQAIEIDFLGDPVAQGLANTEPEPELALPTSDDVDAERARRVAMGFDFGGTTFQSRPEDRENLAGASTAALAAMMQGAQPNDLRWHGGGSDFVWIAADNSLVPLDAQSMFALGQAAMAHKQAMMFAARAIKDADPIPADFATNDAYWP